MFTTLLGLTYSFVRSGPEVIKLFFMLSSTEHEISIAHKKPKILKNEVVLALNLSDTEFIMLINVKMPTIVYEQENFVLS